jgi:hypothetical protein
MLRSMVLKTTGQIAPDHNQATLELRRCHRTNTRYAPGSEPVKPGLAAPGGSREPAPSR